jgi:nucleotide-binding universal stress UspA family protein
MSTILVPLDGSLFAEHALPMAVGIARRAGARLTLLTVHEPPALGRAISGAPAQDFALDRRESDTIRARRRGYLEHVQRGLRESDADVPVDVLVLDGPPATTIAEYVEQMRPALVVMTTHGRGGISRLWLGSVLDEVIRHVTLPVLALRPSEALPIARRRPVQRVLVALDGSPGSEGIVAAVGAVLGHGGVQYTLLSVVPPLRADAVDWDYWRDLAQEQRAADAYLHDLAKRLQPLGLSVDVETRRNVPPEEAILAAAAEIDADVIALATHARGPIGRVVFGSVADKVLRTASTPVLLYPMPIAESPETTAANVDTARQEALVSG